MNTRASAAKSAASTKPKPTPIVAAAATTGDMPVYLDGVGTAQALNTVLLKTRVDGQIVEVDFIEGQSVRQGETLAKIDPGPYLAMLHQAQAQQQRDEASRANANVDLQRYKDAKDAIPQQTLDTAQSTVDQLTATVAVDKAQVEAAQLNVNYTNITAPVDGRVGLRFVDIGNIVHATDTTGLATITTVQPITVVFTLPQVDLPQVQQAMDGGATVSVLAYNSDFSHLLSPGKLSALDNEIDIASDTFRLKATFENKDNALFPNQFVNARLLAKTEKNVVIVPSEAVQQSPTSTYVYLIGPDKKAHQQNVTPGHTEGDKTVIEKGLKAGQMVATMGLDRLEEGTLVTLRTAGTQPAATGAASRPATRKKPAAGDDSSSPESSGSPTASPADDTSTPAPQNAAKSTDDSDAPAPGDQNSDRQSPAGAGAPGGGSGQ